jgi:hypothetical protein
VVVSNGQKQSINDAFQYVTVLTHPHEGVGMDGAKLAFFIRNHKESLPF